MECLKFAIRRYWAHVGKTVNPTHTVRRPVPRSKTYIGWNDDDDELTERISSLNWQWASHTMIWRKMAIGGEKFFKWRRIGKRSIGLSSTRKTDNLVKAAADVFNAVLKRMIIDTVKNGC